MNKDKIVGSRDSNGKNLNIEITCSERNYVELKGFQVNTGSCWYFIVCNLNKLG